MYGKLHRLYVSMGNDSVESYETSVEGVTMNNVSKVMSQMETLTQLIIEQHVQQ